MGKVSRRPKAGLHYGVVRVVAGKLKGKLAYFDDTEAGRAIVYVGTPGVSEFHAVAYSSLRQATETEAEAWRESVENELAQARARSYLRRKR